MSDAKTPPDAVHDLLTIVGNRPQFIKMAPLSAALRARKHREYIVHTGQHFDDNMSRVFFEELGLPAPDVNLDISTGHHGEMTGRMLMRIEQVLLERRPKCVLVYGDTNSTLAAALAAIKLQIPFAHVEAGPRIYDMNTPEEINRIVADHGARLRFCPDLVSVQNLAKENINEGVHFTGDVMYDAYVHFSEAAKTRSTILDRLGVNGTEYAMLTVHRPNNTDTLESLRRLVDLFKRSPMRIVFPMHPRTEASFKRLGLWEMLQKLPMVSIIPAVGYLDSLQLTNHAAIVLTDSGGLQKEAFFAGKPGIVLFFTTPWPQIEKAGWQFCAWRDDGMDVSRILESMRSYRPKAGRPDLFGDGHASEKIVDILERQGWLASKG